MNEKHICKICLAEVSQLQRHLTMKHNKILLMQYLTQFNCGEEYNNVYDSLRKKRAKNSPWSVEYYLARGNTEDEAKLFIADKKRKRKKPLTNPADPVHWLNKGYTIDDAIKRSEQYRNDIGALPSLEKYIIRYGDIEGKIKWEKYQKAIELRQQKFLSRASSNINEAKLIRWFKTSKTEKGEINRSFNYEDFTSYCAAVGTATKISVAVYGDIIDPGRNRLGIIYGKNGYSLDHKFSKYGGFVNKIHPLIIGSYENLQLLPKEKNIQKGQYCELSLDQIRNCKTILDDPQISNELKRKINEIFIEQS